MGKLNSFQHIPFYIHICLPLTLMKLYGLEKFSHLPFCLRLDDKYIEGPEGKHWTEFTCTLHFLIPAPISKAVLSKMFKIARSNPQW